MNFTSVDILCRSLVPTHSSVLGPPVFSPFVYDSAATPQFPNSSVAGNVNAVESSGRNAADSRIGPVFCGARRTIAITAIKSHLPSGNEEVVTAAYEDGLFKISEVIWRGTLGSSLRRISVGLTSLLWPLRKSKTASYAEVCAAASKCRDFPQAA